MRILQVVHGFPPANTAGTEVYTHALALGLAKRHDVSVFYRSCDFRQRDYSIMRMRYENFDVFVLNNTFRGCDGFGDTYNKEEITENFIKALDRINPEIAHIQHLMYLSASIIAELKKRRIPIVFTLNDYWLICPQGQLFRPDGEVCDGISQLECESCVRYQLAIKKRIAGFYEFIRNSWADWLLPFAKNAYLWYARKTFLSSFKATKDMRKRADFMRKAASLVDIFIAPSKDPLTNIFPFDNIPRDVTHFLCAFIVVSHSLVRTFHIFILPSS